MRVSFKPFIGIVFMGFVFVVMVKPVLASVDVQQWQAANGAKVIYVHAPQLPMLDIQVSFDAGSARDGKTWGVASMMTTLLGLKTKHHGEEVLSDKINDLGANIGGSVSRDMANFTLRTLTRDTILKPALQLFSETLTESVFDDAIFERERKRLLVGLKQRQLTPNAMARDAFWAMLYGDHPYAHPISGTVESVENLTKRDIEAFYQRYIVSNNALISIVGNVNQAQAKHIAEQLLTGLPKGKKPELLRAPMAAKTVVQQRHKVIEFDSTQTYFTQGQIGVARGDPDYYALFLGNHLLGGSGFGSLLMEEVREKRGLVYGVGSSFSPMRQAGPWLVSLSTKNKSAKEAQKVVNQTIASFMKGFDDQHFQAIKDNLIGGFPLRIDSNGKIMGYITMIGFYGLPLDYLERFPKKIRELTKQQVLEAWRRHMHLEQMHSVMVGKPE